MPWALSVKHKIILSLWMVTFLLVVLAGSTAGVWFSRDQAGRLDEFLVQESTLVKEAFETYFVVNGTESPEADSVASPLFRSFLNQYLRDRVNRPLPYKTTLGVFDAQGTLIQTSNSAVSLDVVDQSLSTRLITSPGPPPYRFAVVPLAHGGRVLGTVRMACLTVTLAEVVNSFLISLAAVLLVIFFSFGFLGTWLIHWSFWPVQQMSLSAQEISESHLDHRLIVPPGRDEISEMAYTLNRLLDRLERDFEFEEALVGQLSHELRTPLAILRVRNEVTLERLPQTMESMRPLLEDNLADIDHVASLLNTLLGLARLEGRIDPIPLVPCDLRMLLIELIEEFEPLWEDKDLVFDLNLPGAVSEWSLCPELPVRGDPVLVRQIFVNLFTNAYKYTPLHGRLRLTVEMVASSDHLVWRTVLQNPGPSLPEDALELVFKRFYRVESTGPQGFGLGLSIAKTLVDLHGGTIRAFNPPGGGAAFEVNLPGVRSSSPGNEKRRS